MTAEFSDPRLVAIYDTVNSYDPGTQPDFYARLAAELGATVIVDLGCGTGMISCELARLGYQVIGVEPAPRMLDIARHRPFADEVHWIEGDAGRLGTPDADLAIMTGHVAQFFLTDESWHAALMVLYSALRSGGHLAFESRNPGAREWEAWAEEDHQLVHDPVAGRIETWSEVQDISDGIVRYSIHYVMTSTGEQLVSENALRFRTEEEIRDTLAEAGFSTEQIYGDWDRRPSGRATRELIVVAVR